VAGSQLRVPPPRHGRSRLLATALADVSAGWWADIMASPIPEDTCLCIIPPKPMRCRQSLQAVGPADGADRVLRA
jgi:hypothetical protein